MSANSSTFTGRFGIASAKQMTSRREFDPTGAADLITGLQADLIARLVSFVVALERHEDDLGDDAKHWLRDLQQQAHQFHADLTLMECEQCPSLAVWLHPDANERYCAQHAHQFVQCPRCSQYGRLDQMVGETPMHEACYGGGR